MIGLILISSLCIVLFNRKKDNDKLALYEQIRENCKKEISHIHDMESEDYIKKIDVTISYRLEDVYSGSKDKSFDDYTLLIVRLDESYADLDVKDRVIELIKYDDMLHKNMVEYLAKAGYEEFMNKYGVRDNYFEVNGTRYYAHNDYNIEYYCGSDEYVLFAYRMNIENHRTGKQERYDFSYEDGKLEYFEKYEPPKKKDNTSNTTESTHNVSGKTASKKSSSKKTTEKSHDPDDYDIDAYYNDYKDEFEDEDDAWDDFEDNEMWDAY